MDYASINYWIPSLIHSQHSGKLYKHWKQKIDFCFSFWPRPSEQLTPFQRVKPPTNSVTRFGTFLKNGNSDFYNPSASTSVAHKKLRNNKSLNASNVTPPYDENIERSHTLTTGIRIISFHFIHHFRPCYFLFLVLTWRTCDFFVQVIFRLQFGLIPDQHVVALGRWIQLFRIAFLAAIRITQSHYPNERRRRRPNGRTTKRLSAFGEKHKNGNGRKSVVSVATYVEQIIPTLPTNIFSSKIRNEDPKTPMNTKCRFKNSRKLRKIIQIESSGYRRQIWANFFIQKPTPPLL